jgi:hypothetical protein
MTPVWISDISGCMNGMHVRWSWHAYCCEDRRPRTGWEMVLDYLTALYR